MSVSPAQVAVSTTPARLSVAAPTDRSAGQSVAITSCDVDLYLGGDDEVDSSSGALLPAGVPYSQDLAAGEDLWAVTDSGAGTAHVMRGGV